MLFNALKNGNQFFVKRLVRNYITDFLQFSLICNKRYFNYFYLKENFFTWQIQQNFWKR